jgi:DNA-binding XRE family transcriptional regulator
MSVDANEQVMFHNRIRLLRTERSISRQQLADAVGVHVQTIGYIERRQYNLSLALAFRLAGYFGVSLDALFSPEPFELLSNETLIPQ